jgi:hypothetical protein
MEPEARSQEEQVADLPLMLGSETLRGPVRFRIHGDARDEMHRYSPKTWPHSRSGTPRTDSPRSSRRWRTQAGGIAREERDDEQARELFQEALRAARTSPSAITLLTLLRDVAVLSARTGAAKRAARLLGAEAALRVEMGLAPDEVSAVEREQAVAQTRSTLGETAWSRLEELGRTMSLEEAVSYALGETA